MAYKQIATSFSQ